MDSSDLILLVSTNVVGGLMIIMSIFFFLGKGASLIAGYNTMSKEEKATYDTKKLTRFAGILMLIIGILTILLGVFGTRYLLWSTIGYVVVVMLLTVIAIIYANTKQRFKRGGDNKGEDL